MIYKILKKNQIDIVHCNSARQFKGVLAGFLTGKRVIWHLQDTWSPQIINIFFMTTGLVAKHFITAGEKVQQYYLKSFPFSRKSVKIIQAPVDTSYYNPNFVAIDNRVKLNQAPTVLSVGNINPAKGFEYFVRAVHYLKNNKNNPNFWIVGPHFDSQKHYYEHLQELVKEYNLGNFFFYGSSDNVRSILKSADIYVCSSIHEASPISVWEAMAMGKAIVATDVGDVKHFIRDGENGFVVPTRDPKALAEKIDILLNDSELRESFGVKARETAVEHLDISVCAQKHAEFYRQVLQSN
jgi:glycosyltransferase involved in cell wall biosynthesis